MQLWGMIHWFKDLRFNLKLLNFTTPADLSRHLSLVNKRLADQSVGSIVEGSRKMIIYCN